MRERLEEEHEIKTQINTPWITTVLRFILPMDRQTAYSYSRVLQVAHDENLTAQELPNYIKERGGIGKITTTKEEEQSFKSIKEHKDAKTEMLKKILQANAKSAQTIVQGDYMISVKGKILQRGLKTAPACKGRNLTSRIKVLELETPLCQNGCIESLF